MAAYLHLFINGRKFDIDDGVKELMTGGEIAALAGVPANLAVVHLDPKIDPKDLRIDTLRSPAPGRKDCGVRIIHVPSAVSSVSDNESSQIKNRAKAMQLLRVKLYESGHVQPRRIAAYEQISIEEGDYFSVTCL